MAQLTSGTVKYGRTVNGGDYNSKRADVELTFTVAEGEEEGAAVQHVSELAVFKCHEILHKLSAGASSRPNADKPISAPAATEVAAPAETPAAPAKRQPGRPPKNKGPATDPTEVQEPTHTTDTAASADAGSPAEDPSEVVEDWSAAAPEVTDVDLTAAISKHNAKVKNPQAIRQLIGKYVPSPGQARDIAQAQRSAFLVELETVGAPGT